MKMQYSKVVFGLAMFISATIFSFSPAIEKLLLSGYTQRRNKDGEIEDDYIYSIKFNRLQFENENLAEIEPKDFCMRAENRCKQTATGLFQKIVPFESLSE